MDVRSFKAEDSGVAPGTVYWITGLPGAGKKTLGETLARRLAGADRPVVRLDDVRLGEILGGRFGPGQSERRAAAGVSARLCAGLANQGCDVVIATVSMFHEVRRWNRAHIPAYAEIYLRASPRLLAQRRPKGLVAAGLAGRIRNVPGVDLPVEEPEAPDVLVEVAAETSAEAVAETVLGRLRGALPESSRADIPAPRLS